MRRAIQQKFNSCKKKFYFPSTLWGGGAGKTNSFTSRGRGASKTSSSTSRSGGTSFTSWGGGAGKTTSSTLRGEKNSKFCGAQFTKNSIILLRNFISPPPYGVEEPVKQSSSSRRVEKPVKPFFYLTRWRGIKIASTL